MSTWVKGSQIVSLLRRKSLVDLENFMLLGTRYLKLEETCQLPAAYKVLDRAEAMAEMAVTN